MPIPGASLPEFPTKAQIERSKRLIAEHEQEQRIRAIVRDEIARQGRARMLHRS